MDSSNLMITLVGLVGAMFAINNVNKKSTKENFFGLPSRQVRAERVIASSPQAAMKGDFYSVPGTYQAMLNPRFSNVDYGANIRYNMPSHENQATPCNPLSMGNMVKENYCGSCGGGCGAVGCRKGGLPAGGRVSSAPSAPSNYGAGNFNEVLDTTYSASQYPDATSTLPVGDMTAVNAAGELQNAVVYDRYIYSNRNSRLRAHGDPIRGDLPIVPHSNEWFRPSVHPSVDLQEGAMNVMGGLDNSTSLALAELIHASSGNADTAIGGVNMANQLSANLNAGMRDVQITAFP